MAARFAFADQPLPPRLTPRAARLSRRWSPVNMTIWDPYRVDMTISAV